MEQLIITLRWDSRLPNKITCDVDTLFPLGKYYLYKHEYYNAEDFFIGKTIHYKYTLNGINHDMVEIKANIEDKDFALKQLRKAILDIPFPDWDKIPK